MGFERRTLRDQTHATAKTSSAGHDRSIRGARTSSSASPHTHVVGGTIRLCATRDHSRWRRRRKVRGSERDDAMNYSRRSCVEDGRARARAKRERDTSSARERERALRLTTRSRRRRQGEQGEQGGQVCEEGRQGKASQEAILRHLPQVRRATRADDANGPRGCGDPARRRDGCANDATERLTMRTRDAIQAAHLEART